MSDTLENSEDQVEDTSLELSMLKNRARVMGIQFSNNIGLQALKAKIEAKLATEEPDPMTQLVEEEEGVVPPVVVTKPKTLRQKLIEDSMKLVRVRVTNMDPKKKDLQGEVFTVANEYIGTVRRYVPFGELTENGWHVEQVIFDMMKSRKFVNIRTIKDPKTGRERHEHSWATEFGLEVLPQLTQAELTRIANAQAAAGGFEE